MTTILTFMFAFLLFFVSDLLHAIYMYFPNLTLGTCREVITTKKHSREEATLSCFRILC